MILCIFLICVDLCVVLSTETFNYEKENYFGVARRDLGGNDYWPNEYREILSSTHTPYIRSPYTSLYQGARLVNDTCVFKKKFHQPAKRNQFKMFVESVFECTLTHMAIETTGNKPILLRGGVGYKSFTVIVQVEAGEELLAHVKAYCAHKITEDSK